MVQYFNDNITVLINNVEVLLSVMVTVIHILCAMGVSRDLSNFSRRNITPQLVSSFAWVLITLISGVWGLLVYWVLHHSSLARGR